VLALALRSALRSYACVTRVTHTHLLRYADIVRNAVRNAVRNK
jgi:hypothetical protein